MRRVLVPAIIVSVACSLLGAQAAAAQYVRGTVSDADTGVPVSGALVVLLDAEGASRASVLAGETGQFLLSARTPGTYSLRVQRIGFRDVVTAPFEVRAGAMVEQNVRVTPDAIVLEGITAEARRRCVLRPRQGLAVATLWGEARKALEAAQLTERHASYRYRVHHFERELDPRSLRVLREENRSRTGFAERSPFVSLPAERLLGDGFVQFTDTASYYYAPDADVLLSDAFLDAYCFRVAEQGRASPDLVGLSFEPADRRGPPAVEGTLWLNRHTFELQHLEYRYTRTPLLERVRGIGGRVEFESLPNGTWIVRRWWIRMPELEQRMVLRGRRQATTTVAALAEAGGEVMEVMDPQGVQRIRSASLGTLSGLVFDSAAAMPLAGAIVHLEGTERSVVADDQGRYRMDDVREGEYRVVFTHPLAALYDYPLPPAHVSVEHGRMVELDLAVPLGARGTGRLAACSGRARHPSGHAGVLTGYVTDELTGEPLPGATVTLSWEETDGAGNSVTQRRTAVVDREGAYIACGIPERRGEMHADISLGERRAARGTAPMPYRDNVALIDFALRLTDPQPVVIIVLEQEHLRPVANARLTLTGPGLHGVSDRYGRVAFEAVPPGRHAIGVEHAALGAHAAELAIGTEPSLFELRVRAAGAGRDGVSVLPLTELARTRGDRINVMDRAEIARLLPLVAHVGHIAERIPGLHVDDRVHGTGGTRSGLCVRSPRGARLAGVTATVLPCAVVILDGQRLDDTEQLLSLAPDEVEAVEFVEPASAGPGYGTVAGQVGALLVWTRGNGPYVR